jgi:hypothetical protein
MEDPFWIRHVHPEFPDGPHYAIKEGFAKRIPFIRVDPVGHFKVRLKIANGPSGPLFCVPAACPIKIDHRREEVPSNVFDHHIFFDHHNFPLRLTK